MNVSVVSYQTIQRKSRVHGYQRMSERICVKLSTIHRKSRVHGIRE